MAIFNREYEPPTPDEADTAHAVARAVFNAVPVIGGALVETLNKIIAPPLSKRQAEWMEDVAQAIRQLEREKGVPAEKLRDDPAFIDAVLSATGAAIRTSQQEKRKALRNAVFNSALPHAPEVAVQQMFIATVDRFTDWHLLILKLFHDPQAAADKAGYRPVMMSSLEALLEQSYPQLRGKREFYDLVWSDLNSGGFVGTPSLHTTMSVTGATQKRTTALGDQFLKFIADPLP